MPVYLQDGSVLLDINGKVAVDSACCCCFSRIVFVCVGIMCSSNDPNPSWTSVFDLSPDPIDISTWQCDTPLSFSGSEGPSDFATLNWFVDLTPDGFGGYSASYGGTVTGRYGQTQAFNYVFDGDCCEFKRDSHTDRFCGTAFGNCGDLGICGLNIDHILAFDGGAGFEVTLQLSP